MDEDLMETKLQSEALYRGKLLHVYRDTVRLPDGKTATREWIDHPGACAVVPFLPDGRVVLVRQCRYPVGRVTLELPAGKLDRGEAPEVCARRELREETGYTAEKLVPITAMGTAMAFSNEIIHLFAASGLRSGAQCTDDDEFINAVPFALPELYEKIRCGEIDDSKTLVALLMLKAFPEFLP